MSAPGSNPPAGWYRDPAGGAGERFWDGVAWSQATRDVPAPEAQPAPSAPVAPGYAPASGVPYGQYPYAAFATGPAYAGFWWRVLGYVIDTTVLSLATSLIAPFLPANAMLYRSMEVWVRDYVMWLQSPAGEVPLPPSEFWTATLWLTVFNLVLYAIYRTALLGTLSATLGQWVCGLRVVKDGDEPTARLSWGQAVLRGVVGALLWQLLSFLNGLFAAILPKKQALSDVLSRTVVYRVR